MESNLILRGIVKNWWLLLLMALLAAAAALAVNRVSLPTYETRARFIVSPDSSVLSDQNDYLYSLNVLDKRTLAATFVEVITSQNVRDQVAGTLQVDPAELQYYTLDAVVLPETNVVEVIVHGPQPQIAGLMAATAGQTSIDYMNRMYKGYTFAFLDHPPMPTESSSPGPVRFAGIAMVLGLALGAGLAVLKELIQSLAGAPRLLRKRGSPEAVLPWSQFEKRLNAVTEQKSHPPFSLGMIRVGGWSADGDGIPPAEMDRVMEQSLHLVDRELRDEDLLGRYNQNTLAVLLEGANGPAAAAALNRVQLGITQRLAGLHRAGWTPLQARVGLVEHVPGVSANQLIARATQALENSETSSSSLGDTLPGLIPQTPVIHGGGRAAG